MKEKDNSPMELPKMQREGNNYAKDVKEIREAREKMEEVVYGSNRFLVIRNVLNLVFIVLAVIGVAVYLLQSETVGTVILIFAIILKFAETILRIMH
jgi:hypothetical protein